MPLYVICLDGSQIFMPLCDTNSSLRDAKPVFYGKYEFDPYQLHSCPNIFLSLLNYDLNYMYPILSILSINYIKIKHSRKIY